MFCCTKCFADTEIKAIIEGNKRDGDCNFCGSQNVRVYEIETNHIITELLDGLLDIYSPISALPIEFPKEQTNLLKNILYDTWKIFNLPPEQIDRLIKLLCADRYKDQPELFDTPVGIKQSQDKDYLEDKSILKKNKWSDFVNGIKSINRFHSNYINTEKLSVFLHCTTKIYRKGHILYRARICPSIIGFKKKDMGAPPNHKVSGGRVNPAGISILYLSDSVETTLYEIRARVYDYVTIGRFRLQEDIKIINLADIDHISPFIGINHGFEFLDYALNIEHLRMIAQEIAKPLRNDNVLDYIPTQYISDYIRSKKYDGIEYNSTMHKGGSNLALFDSKLVKCINTSVYDIREINYKYDKL